MKLRKRVTKKATQGAKKKKATVAFPKGIQIQDGDWCLIRKSGAEHISCCDCGLTHSFKFKVVRECNDNRIVYQVFRNDPRTEQVRKERKFICKQR